MVFFLVWVDSLLVKYICTFNCWWCFLAFVMFSQFLIMIIIGLCSFCSFIFRFICKFWYFFLVWVDYLLVRTKLHICSPLNDILWCHTSWWLWVNNWWLWVYRQVRTIINILWWKDGFWWCTGIWIYYNNFLSSCTFFLE